VLQCASSGSGAGSAPHACLSSDAKAGRTSQVPGRGVLEIVAEFGPSYGEVSPEGEEHFRVIVEKTAELLAIIPGTSHFLL
jgi:hypothetical protein